MRKPTLSLLLLLSAIGLIACESTTIRMNYTPDPQPLHPSATGLSLYVDTFEDARGAKAPEVVGDVHTTFFNVRQPATLEGGVVDITTDAFQEAFKAAGFNVVEDDESADLILRGRINSLSVKEIAGSVPEYSEAEVELDVAVFDGETGNKLWFDVLRTSAKEPSYLDATPLNEPTLNKAFKEAVDSAVANADLRSAIDQFAETRD